VRLGVHGAETLVPRYRAEAKIRAEQIAPIIRELQRDGYSFNGMAVELEKRNMPTPRGGSWHPQLVKRIVPSFVDSPAMTHKWPRIRFLGCPLLHSRRPIKRRYGPP
jgi:Recombinase